MREGTKVHFEADRESTLAKIKQTLGLSDVTIRVKTRDGEVWTNVLHVASKMVRDLVQGRGCCAVTEPLLILPDAEKRTVALLDRILQHGAAILTLDERENVEKIAEKLNEVTEDLGFELVNFQVRPGPDRAITRDHRLAHSFNQARKWGDSNNNITKWSML